jgi:nucleotide-binding universal stress UspA family protein
MKVLVATEGSKFSNAAIDKCCAILSPLTEADLRIVAASEPAVVPAEPFALSADYIREIDEDLRRRAEEVVSNAEQEIRKRLPEIGSRLTTTVSSGAPAQVIVHEAENWGADLIVVGSHGYGFWQRALLGSVSDAVVHHAPCSVLVVRGNEATNGTNN